MIRSPMNYTGGKGRLLPEILPLFPARPARLHDLFAGGLNVAINADAERKFANDINNVLIDLYRTFSAWETDALICELRARIAREGLSSENREAFLAFRKKYNESRDPLDLFILCCHSFNHQLRLNSAHEFNAPFGRKRSFFNPSIESRLRAFCRRLSEISLSSLDFRDYLSGSGFGEGDFFYCDPPYSISSACYNDGKRGFRGWGPEDDADLFRLLDSLHEKGAKFALSNVAVHKGAENGALIEWMAGYRVHEIASSYSNSCYCVRDRKTATREVLVVNY